MARGRGPRVGHDQVLLLRVTQHTQIGGLLDVAIAAARSSSSAAASTWSSCQDTDIVQVRYDIGGRRIATSSASASTAGRGIAAGAAAGAAAAGGSIAVLLMAAGGEIARRRLRLRLHLNGDGRGGGRRRAIRDSQVRETAKESQEI